MKGYLHSKFESEIKNALTDPMKIIYHTAREGQTHTIKEKLVKHFAIGLFARMLDEEAARKIQLVLKSDNMIQRRIKDFAAKVLDE